MRPCWPLEELDEEMEAASAATDLNGMLGVGSTLTPWITSEAAAAAALRGNGLSVEQQAQEERKMEVCNDIFYRLRDIGHAEATNCPGFLEELQSHFTRLPYRYSLDVNVERAEDVLMHKRLLELAVIPENRPVFNVRAVHVFPVGIDDPERFLELSPMNASPTQGDFFPPDFPWQSSLHPPPSFGSSIDLEAVDLKLNIPSLTGEVIDRNGGLPFLKPPHKPMHEITFSTMDKTKLLSKLSSLLADAGLNIREAHVFCTVDGYSLDVFVVDGWSTEDTEELKHALEDCIAKVEKGFWSTTSPSTSPTQPKTKTNSSDVENFKILTDGSDDWELDLGQLKLNYKVASGSSRDLFRGTYCGQDVAIKVLKPECLFDDLQKEFAQEIFIMRKVRHRNVVQFIGACTKAPTLCIVTEFMTGGSIHDYLHKKKEVFKLPKLLMVAMDISKGMDYLHQNNIIHRDLKAANLLMDENGVVKVADFGVSRVQTHSGIMTAETGTYRWMAPEVIEHKPYDRKADVFSFGIVLWELLTGKIPYDDLTPLQAAVGVVQKALRPIIPEDAHAGLAELLRRCWEQEPSKRPGFSEITVILQEILKEDSACKSPKT